MNQETAEAWGLAAVGAGAGIYNYFLKPNFTARNAWIAMGFGILAYEILAPPGELLSEGADSSIEAHPILTRAAIGLTALHLLNLIPESIDPLHQATKLGRRIYGKAE